MEFIKKYKYPALALLAATVLAAAVILLGGRADTRQDDVSQSLTESSEISKVTESASQTTDSETKPAVSTAATSEKPQSTTVESLPEKTESSTIFSSDLPQTSKPAVSPPPATVKPPATAAPVTTTQTSRPATEAIPSKRYDSKCTFVISCVSLLDNLDRLDKNKRSLVPENGILFSSASAGFDKGESVYDILRRICTENDIQLEASYTPALGSSYIEGINNLYEFDCGSSSGWLYTVNGVQPDTGCSSFKPKDGDKIEFIYKCGE